MIAIRKSNNRLSRSSIGQSMQIVGFLKVSGLVRLVVVGAGVFILCFGFCGCATYHVGNQFLYRNDIRTVHVEVFESNSFRRFLGQRLTEAVIKEIELSTPLAITEPQLAHSFLRGRILNDVKNPRGETINDDVRVLDTAWSVEVTWTDRAGVPLMQRQVLRIYREGVLIPEGGQSLSTTQQNLIEQFARDVVNQMESCF